jgi:hypothetical protein
MQIIIKEVVFPVDRMIEKVLRISSYRATALYQPNS